MTRILSNIIILTLLCSSIASLVPLASATGGDWETVITITGRGYKTSELFRISESQWRIAWSYTTDDPGTATFALFAYPRDDTVLYSAFISESGASQGDVSYVYEGNEDYYLVILAANLDDWTITIEQPGSVARQPAFGWITIATITGQGHKISAPFAINTSFWRFQWAYTTSLLDSSAFSLFVYPEGETTSYVSSLSVRGVSDNDTDYVYTGDDSYYFDVLAANLEDWALTVQIPRELIIPTLTCSLSASSIEISDSVTISGSITPAMSTEAS